MAEARKADSQLDLEAPYILIFEAGIEAVRDRLNDDGDMVSQNYKEKNGFPDT